MSSHPRHPEGEASAYHPALDGLRGVFVLAVLLFHAEVPWAQGGFLGVSSFFTLSGFLITRLLLAERGRSGHIDLRRFWTRRFRRLMPASLLTLAAILLFGRTIATTGQLVDLRGDVLSALAYVSNWRFMTRAGSYFEIFDRPSPVQHFWSLSIEEQFYLAYPLLLLAACRGAAPMRRLAIVLGACCVGGVAAGAGLAIGGAEPSRIYYGTDTRAPELIVGALLALWMASPRREPGSRSGADVAAVGGAFVFVVGVVALRDDAPWLYRGGLLAHAIATAALVHAGVRPSVVGRILATTPLVWLGRVSYGVYLYHWPVFLWLDAERTGLATLPLFALRAGVTFAAAALSYVVVEGPVRRERALVGRRLWIGAGVAVLAVAIGGVWVTRDRYVVATALDTLRAAAMPRADDPATPRVLVLGDSIADNVAAGLRLWAERTGTPMALWNVAASACGVGRGGERPSLGRYRQLRNPCEGWETSWGKAVEHFDPDVVIVHTGPLDLVKRRLPGWEQALGPGDPRFEAWLVAEMRAVTDLVSRHGARVIWMTTPCPGPAASRVPLHAIGALDPAGITRLNSFVLPTLWASRERHLRLFDLYGISCPMGRFQRRIPGTRIPLRSDHLHYTGEGAAWIAERLGPIVVAAVRVRRGEV